MTSRAPRTLAAATLALTLLVTSSAAAEPLRVLLVLADESWRDDDPARAEALDRLDASLAPEDRVELLSLEGERLVPSREATPPGHPAPAGAVYRLSGPYVEGTRAGDECSVLVVLAGPDPVPAPPSGWSTPTLWLVSEADGRVTAHPFTAWPMTGSGIHAFLDGARVPQSQGRGALAVGRPATRDPAMEPVQLGQNCRGGRLPLLALLGLVTVGLAVRRRWRPGPGPGLHPSEPGEPSVRVLVFGDYAGSLGRSSGQVRLGGEGQRTVFVGAAAHPDELWLDSMPETGRLDLDEAGALRFTLVGFGGTVARERDGLLEEFDVHEPFEVASGDRLQLADGQLHLVTEAA